ncbi:MAG: transcriptional regulator [Glaciihabitans sp.]|nr:transcriptional regulator [Glaciihabitans sp.]
MNETPAASSSQALASELRVLIGRLRRRLREGAQVGDFTPSQVSVVTFLEREGPATVTTLAKAEGVRPQSMGANVAVLEAAGYITGEPDPNDGRQTLLTLTPSARVEIATGRAAREDWLYRAITTNLDDSEQRQLASAIELLKRIANS